MRQSEIIRETRETAIKLFLDIDGSGQHEISTGVGFLDHMLELFSSHGRFDLNITCKGDLHVDAHHSTEDIGITLGQAFSQALGDKKGITRYGHVILPMDEALILTAIDFSGRAYLSWDMNINASKVGDFDTELAQEFWLGFVRNSQSTIHFKQLAGSNAHHIIECAFKSIARSIAQAVKINPDYENEIPSTKGVL